MQIFFLSDDKPGVWTPPLREHTNTFLRAALLSLLWGSGLGSSEKLMNVLDLLPRKIHRYAKF